MVHNLQIEPDEPANAGISPGLPVTGFGFEASSSASDAFVAVAGPVSYPVAKRRLLPWRFQKQLL